MIDSFNAGADIHTKTAADLHGVAPEDVTKNMRRDAKVINFGILYGMGPHALADNTGMSFVEARKFIDRYFELRYKVREYLDNILRQARDEGYVETYYGRRRLTPDVKSSNFVVRSAAERAAMNMPIQGTEADLVKRAMIAVEGELAGGPSPDGPGEPFGVQILQIHDSILVECPRENADTVSRILRETMENIAPELPIKLKVDVTAGDNWGEV
jgi:DNA polymerase I - 3''-5'' exonuclease and polymerase domains